MALHIKFDSTHNAYPPTFILATRSGKKLGAIPAKSIVVREALDECMEYVELRFSVYKKEDGVEFNLWDKLKDFKLVYCKEWDMWFEIRVELSESDYLVKNVNAHSLGQAELSQINIYSTEINTEIDIARSDYSPTVFYDPANPGASLLHRILDKAPHYSILHVDERISKIQRSFSFSGISVYDALKEIAKEINCIFIIGSGTSESGEINRTISARDLSSCCECGEREEFADVCPVCGSTNLTPGYGVDTTVFVSTDNLAEDITYSTDVDSVKNCFNLVAGDDLMTATVANCNPNGSSYIWYISDDIKEDMSEELVNKLNAYDNSYNYYQNEYVANISATKFSEYNTLVDKYSTYSSELEKMPVEIKGYPALMNAYYNTIDFDLFLTHKLMPDIDLSEITASSEASKITQSKLSPVSVQSLSSLSAATATSYVLSMAKTLVNSNYQVRAGSSTFSGSTWRGNFVITNYSDDNDTHTTGQISVTLNENKSGYVDQKIVKKLSGEADDSVDIVALFKKGDTEFKAELKKYCLNRLVSFHDAAQACLNILIEQGVSNKGSSSIGYNGLYDSVYMNYYNKSKYISDEIKVREADIAAVVGKYDANGKLISSGLQTLIEKERKTIQAKLNLETYLGTNLWLEFMPYRREDTYQNTNYISDGLDNAQIFDNALQFINVARREIYKSATLQHTISATLKNLLVMKEFAPIVDNFSIGNWIRIKVDKTVYKLRLVEYEINYDDLKNLSITFSDVRNASTGVQGVQNILVRASAIADSFDTVSKDANHGKLSHQMMNKWSMFGFDLSKIKIVDRTNNNNIEFGSHGISCKEYLPITDSYDGKQLKFINRGIYLTDDDWLTSRGGIGDFSFYNPATGTTEQAYGVTADNMIGNYILSETAGIYNTKNSIVMDQNGLTITTDGAATTGNEMALTIQKKDSSGSLSPIMYVDTGGNLVLNGTIKISASTDPSVSSIDDLADMDRITDEANRVVEEELADVNETINKKCQEVLDEATYQLNEYKADVGQYMHFDNDGLTLGADSSNFKTVIDNQRLAFKDGNNTVSYISNSQLYIKSAVIQNALNLGNYFFVVKPDGGFQIAYGS